MHRNNLRPAVSSAHKQLNNLTIFSPGTPSVLSSQFFLADACTNPDKPLVTIKKTVTEYHPSIIVFLARLGLLLTTVGMYDDQKVSHGTLVIPKTTNLPSINVWARIGQFLIHPLFCLSASDPLQLSPIMAFGYFAIELVRPSLTANDVLVRAALCGDETMAKRLISLDPRYLLTEGDATDFSKRTYKKLKPLHAALVAGDFEMAAMMVPHFNRLDNGIETMRAQYAEIFPRGFDAHARTQELKSNAEFKPILDEIINAIKRASFHELALDAVALNRFQQAFTNLSNSEKIFNPYHLLNALKIYELFLLTARDTRERQAIKQQGLFLNIITEYMKNFLPAYYAQAFAQKLDCLIVFTNRQDRRVDKPIGQLRRFITFGVPDNSSIFPSRSGMGFDFLMEPSDRDFQLSSWANTFQSFITEKKYAVKQLFENEPSLHLSARRGP